MSKATHSEILQRVNTIYKLLLRGASRQEILQYCTNETEWGVKDRTIDIYIARAREYFNERTQIARDTELGNAIQRYELLFQRALKVQDYKTCIQAQARIDKITGLEQNNTNLRITTWQDEAIESIKRGEISYNDFMFAFDDENLAQQLFRQAGVPIE